MSNFYALNGNHYHLERWRWRCCSSGDATVKMQKTIFIQMPVQFLKLNKKKNKFKKKFQIYLKWDILLVFVFVFIFGASHVVDWAVYVKATWGPLCFTAALRWWYKIYSHFYWSTCCARISAHMSKIEFEIWWTTTTATDALLQRNTSKWWSC